MSKRPRASLLLTPAFDGMGLSAQEKDQHFLAFIPIPNAVRNLLFPFLYLSSLYVFSHSLTMSAFPSPPLSNNPLNPPYQGDDRVPRPPDKGGQGGSALPTTNQPLRQIRRHERNGLNQEYEGEKLARLSAFPSCGQPLILSTID